MIGAMAQLLFGMVLAVIGALGIAEVIAISDGPLAAWIIWSTGLVISAMSWRK